MSFTGKNWLRFSCSRRQKQKSFIGRTWSRARWTKGPTQQKNARYDQNLISKYIKEISFQEITIELT